MTETNQVNHEQELNFEDRIAANYGSTENTTSSAIQERLKDVNKKLPAWNLEPPFDYIK